MYGKLFAQMYDGTLVTAGWQALVTFQQLVILADKRGIVDMTADAICRKTTIPMDVIAPGLTALQLPDPNSRTPDEDGRRIVLIDEKRTWGWRIVNYKYYRNLRNEEERREYHRQYWHTRKDSTNATGSTPGSTGSTDSTAPQQTQPSARMQEAGSSKQEENPPLPPSGGASEESKPAPKKRAAPKADKPPFDPKTLAGLNLEAFAKWVEYRRQRRPPIKEYSMEGAARKLLSFGTMDEQMAVVLNSIADQYQGLVAPKSFQRPGGNGGGGPVLTFEQREAIELQKLQARRDKMPELNGFRNPNPGELAKDYRAAQDTEFERVSDERRARNAPRVAELAARVQNIGKTGVGS